MPSARRKSSERTSGNIHEIQLLLRSFQYRFPVIIFEIPHLDSAMMPAGPLMIEHRLIERMVRQLQEELNRIDKRNSVDAVFIDSAVDFFRFYTDRCHHGKE